MRAAGLATAVRTLGQGVVARARALRSGDVWALLSIRTPHCDERLGTS
jgi:hypothetical protein